MCTILSIWTCTHINIYVGVSNKDRSVSTNYDFEVDDADAAAELKKQNYTHTY